MTQATELTIRKSLTVAAPVERAFEVFTERIGSWWPLEHYSIGGDQVEAVVIDQREGGRVYERSKDGSEAEWADVLAWEPPNRLVLRWRVNPKSPATEVEVHFSPEGEGMTRVELEHRGWEAFTDEALTTSRAGYSEGWDLVLGRYQEGVDS